jgi:hypothetical protein
VVTQKQANGEREGRTRNYQGTQIEEEEKILTKLPIP